ncbi:putative squalene synthase [Helianthus anomalus]
MNYRTQRNMLPNINERTQIVFMFIHTTKRTKFFVHVRSFIKQTNEHIRTSRRTVHELFDLKHKENSQKAIECLNDMVTNALVHIEDCLKYMSKLRDPSIFKFCAIPQVFILFKLFTLTILHCLQVSGGSRIHAKP